MTNKEILVKAIEKAEKNGFKFPENNKCFYPIIDNEFDYPYVIYHEDFAGSWCLHINEIIFSHDFAKAFWGEEKYSKQSPEKIHLYQEYYTSQAIMGKNLYLTEKEFIKSFGEKVLKQIQKNNGGSVGKYKVWDCSKYWDICKKEGWQGHLQQMVLEKEPLKYLEKFLKD